MGRAFDHAELCFPQGYLFGLTLSTAGSSATFSVAAGSAADSTGLNIMKLASSTSKTTSAWASGSGNGGLDTGAIAASTWYHAHIIKNLTTGAVDVLVSLSATAPTLPSGYTVFRRIGSMLTNGSSQWTLFHQNGSEFLWDVSVINVNGVALGVTTAVLETLTVPTGVQVNALISVGLFDTVASTQLVITSPDESDQAATTNLIDLIVSSATTWTGSAYNKRTNTSAQVRFRASTTTAKIALSTRGWIDNRGMLY